MIITEEMKKQLQDALNDRWKVGEKSAPKKDHGKKRKSKHGKKEKPSE